MKLGLGIYTNKPEFVEVVRQWNPTVVLLFENGIQLAPAIKAACPSTITVGRWWFDPIQYVPTNPAEAYQRGKEVAAALDIPSYPQIDIWQSYNEYINSGHSLDEWYMYSCFETGFTEVVHYWGKKSVVGNIAVGNGDVERLKQMREALDIADYFGYHGYTSRETPGLVDEFYFSRYKKWVEAYKQLGWRFPPIILTEVGTYYPFKDCHLYPVNQCAELDPRPVFQSILEEMNTDTNVIGGCVFCLGDCGGWSGFNIEGEENIKPTDGGVVMPWDRHSVFDQWFRDLENTGFNPNTAIGHFRSQHPELGVPISPEFTQEDWPYVVQFYTDGIVYSRKSDWHCLIARVEDELPLA